MSEDASSRKVARRWLSKALQGIQSDRERSWGPSKVKRIGVPGADVHLNTRRTCADIFRWRGSAWKAALTSPAAYLHALLYFMIWYAAVVNHLHANADKIGRASCRERV